MNYIKVNRKTIEGYIYFLELNNDNTFSRGIILDIDKWTKIVNKLTWGEESGGLWHWLESKGKKFTDAEIKQYRISKEDFNKYWDIKISSSQ